MKEKPKLRIIRGGEKPIPDRAFVEPVHFKEWEEKGILGVVHRKKFAPDCWHRRRELDSEARMVQCKDCGCYLDPYDVLDRLIRDREQMQRTDQEYKDQVQRLFEMHAELKKELKSLEGKIKRRKANLLKPPPKTPLFKDWSS